MSPLARLALELLEDPMTSVGVKTVACTTILSALEQGVEVVPGSHLVVWRYLLGSDNSTVVLHRHDLAHENVARDAVRVLLDRDAGENAHDLAVAVLKGANVRVITDDDLVTIADRMMDEGKVRRLTWLVERIHEERGLTPEFIVGLRDRLAGSDDPSVRAGAVEVAGVAARLDEHFAIRMVNDQSPLVRAAVAGLLEKVVALDKPIATAIVRRQLGMERHRTVLASLYDCMGSLIRGGGRPAWEN